MLVGSLLGTRAGPQANVIDLTMDDDSSPPARNTRQGTNAPRANPPRRPTNPHLSDRLIDVQAEHERHIGLIGLFHRVGAAGGMSGMEILNRIGTGFGAAGLFRRHAMAADQDRQTYNMPTPVHTHAPDPLAGNLPNFNYGANGYNGGGSVKPVHQAPEKARDGFSRSTGEDQAFVCPSCEEELAYDPDEETRFLGTPATKKVKTKKDREEQGPIAVDRRSQSTGLWQLLLRPSQSRLHHQRKSDDQRCWRDQQCGLPLRHRWRTGLGEGS